ncbi:MAG: UV DNA damage repair endonuclease UvsE [Desulforhopalus sp.]
MIRLGLCCIFREQPIRFRQTTATALQKLARREQLQKLSFLCLSNLESLSEALEWVIANGVGAFRVLSPLFPRMTHPDVAYSLENLPDYREIEHLCEKIHVRRKQSNTRLSLHPDQFNVLSSPHPEVVQNTLRELEYQGLLAEKIGADVINIHGGGVYGDKDLALQRLKKNFERLSERVQSRLALENDDRSYTPADLLPVCGDLGIPMVYDVHHHRCLPDDLSLEEATLHCVKSWDAVAREPYFHISSPREGYNSAVPRPHADYISVEDFPHCWFSYDATVDVEAKAKELAVLQLKKHLESFTCT